MRVHRRFAAPPLILLSLLLLMAYWASAAEKHAKRTYVCAEANPQATCNPSNTCGSASVACRIDVKRTADGASAIPNIPGLKGTRLSA